MPARGIRGGKLAQEILRISEQLEGDFRREFLDEVASYANNPVLKKLLKDIESGSFTAGSSLSSSLANITFASSRLDALARKAMGRSARITAKTTTGFELGFNVINPEVVAIARTMSINLSTSLNKSTRETLRKIIQDAVEGNLTTIQAARKIRTHVGLIPKHADAVDRYYDTLVQSGVKTKLAQKQADAYAQRLLKYRSETIARTEIARAVGEGQTAMWKQMVADGYLPVDARRVWVTALDERTCEICEPMNGVETDIFGSWNTPNGFVSHPQATHPNCRCTQGIIMPKSKVGKSDELELSQWLLSKFNPYHDELGRFTFAPEGVKGTQTRLARQRSVSQAKNLPVKYDNLRYNIATIIEEDLKEFQDRLDAEPDEKDFLIAKRGPKGTKVDEDGLPIILPEKLADKKYGSNLDDVMQYIADNHGIEVSYDEYDEVDPKKIQTDKRILQGSAQFFDDAKKSGIDTESFLEEVIFTEGGGSTIGQFERGSKKITMFQENVHGIKRRMDSAYVGERTFLVQDIVGRSMRPRFTQEQVDNGALDSANGYGIMAHEFGHAVDFETITLTQKATEKLKRTISTAFEKELKDNPTRVTFTDEYVKSVRKDPLTLVNQFGSSEHSTVYEDGEVFIQYSPYSEAKSKYELNEASSKYAARRRDGITDYSRENQREFFAENFSAWFLLSKAKGSKASKFYNQYIADVAHTVDVSNGIMKVDKLVMSDGFEIASYDHPVGFFILSQTSSSKEGVSKANPYHDEIGRFTFAPEGAKVGATTRSATVSARRKYNESIKRIADQSQITESGEYKPSEELIKAFESYTFGGGDYYVVQHQANLKPQTSSKKLHRGMTFEKEEFDKFVGEVKVGKQFQIQSSSWSESLSVAKEFASEEAPSGSLGDYSVIMSVNAGAKGVHIEPYAYVDWKYQKEWYLGDAKYKVTGISVRGKRATISLDYTK